MEFQKKDFALDFVFPIARGEIINEKCKFQEILGTGFLIGNNGYALTAAHVIENVTDLLFGRFLNEQNIWCGIPIINKEYHPLHDIALIKLQGDNWKSPFVISKEKQFGWRDFLSCGYPESTIHEDDRFIDEKGRNIPNPDLISTKGHIRRRIPREINFVKGNMFYELSNIAGWGCSGSPIFMPQPNKSWEVYGIYVAQKLFYVQNEKDDNVKYIDFAVSYAVTSDSFFDWKPELLSKTIQEESLDFTK